MPTRRTVLALTASVAIAGCGDGESDTDGASNGDGTATPSGEDAFGLSSSAFDDGGPIPSTYTADGADESPPLSVSDVPADAESLALVLDDPDAGSEPFVHWLLWNVPADTTTIPGDLPQREHVDALDGAPQGRNDFGELGYRGPAPPSEDDSHTYVFRLTALDTTLDVAAGADRSAVEDAFEGSRVAETTLRGTYDR